MMKIVKLDMEHVNKGTQILALPEYFRGTEKQCKGMMKRFEWCESENLMGGYWVDEELNCYFLLP
jgi:hypothetical protein